MTNNIRGNKDSQQSVSCLIHISIMFISAGSMVALAVSVLVWPVGLSLAHWDIGWWWWWSYRAVPGTTHCKES